MLDSCLVVPETRMRSTQIQLGTGKIRIGMVADTMQLAHHSLESYSSGFELEAIHLAHADLQVTNKIGSRVRHWTRFWRRDRNV